MAMQYSLGLVVAPGIFIWGAIAQEVWGRKSPGGAHGRSLGKNPEDKVPQKLKQWSSLQTLFTDFVCIKNGGLDQCGAEPFEQQQFATGGIEGVNRPYNIDSSQ